MMRHLLLTIMMVSGSLLLKGQSAGDQIEGTVSYISAQNVYVKFSTTSGFSTGDTLFVRRDNRLVPALVVSDFSSISCVCLPIAATKLNVSDKVIHQVSKALPAAEAKPASVPAPIPATIPPPVSETATVQPIDTMPVKTADPNKSRQQIHGNVAIASYSNFSSLSSNTQRMKYTFSMGARNIGNTNLSAECYILFTHSKQNWGEVQNNLFNGLKIYSLNLNYDFGKKASLLLGRKINPKLSNMGANDGLQFEWRFKPLSVGVIAGFRPDYSDYGFNGKLFQAGGYLYNEYAGKHGFMQTTLAFVEQTNDWKTDRRFTYLQHVNSLVKNLVFFGSVEVDLYKLVFNPADSTYSPTNQFSLSNLYLSLSYRIQRKLSMTLSYSARQNVIYYETYKNYLDKLLDYETLQGYQFQVMYAPVKRLSIGVTTAYRFEKTDPRPTKNLYGYVSYSEIPGIRIASTLSATFLETSYIRGNIYSLGISKDLFHGKLYLGATYRYVSYTYYYDGGSLPQNLGEFNLTWRIIKRFSMSAYYEGTFDKQNSYNRIYAQVNIGF
jgi:hypothetical protein